jgi:hypothetical protein
MKNEITQQKQQKPFFEIQPLLLLCLRKLKSFSLRHFLSSQLEPSYYSALEAVLAHPGIQIFRAAFRELASNGRHLFGGGLLVVGCASGMLYHFFEPLTINKDWYFLNWYYFLYTIREELTLAFWAVGTFLLLPSKYKLAFIPCTLALAYSIAYIIHYYFFVDSLESFHADIYMTMWVAAVSLALGFIISVDYLCYRKYHLKDGNAARIIGIAQAPGISNDSKIAIMNTLIDESQNYNARI